MHGCSGHTYKGWWLGLRASICHTHSLAVCPSLPSPLSPDLFSPSLSLYMTHTNRGNCHPLHARQAPKKRQLLLTQSSSSSSSNIDKSCSMMVLTAPGVLYTAR